MDYDEVKRNNCLSFVRGTQRGIFIIAKMTTEFPVIWDATIFMWRHPIALPGRLCNDVELLITMEFHL